MKLLRIVIARVRALFDRESVHGDIDDELQFHLEMETEKYERRGMSREDARRTAKETFGHMGRVKDRANDVRGGGLLESLWQDLRYAFRMLVKSPVFTVVAVLTLALGIGANTAIFSVVYGVLLRPLPYPESERLVILWENRIQQDRAISVAYPDFIDWQKQQHVFDHLSLYRRQGMIMTGTGESERLSGAMADAEFFKALGLSPILGRTYSVEEDKPGANAVVVLHQGFWQSRFAGDPNIIGKTLTLDGVPTTVIGVMPKTAGLPSGVQMWIPLGPQSVNPRLGMLDRSNHVGCYALGVVKRGITIEQARAEMKGIAAGLEKEYPMQNANVGIVLTPMLENAVGEYRRGLFMLLGAALLVLMIVCANLANLLLARSGIRHQEIAVRSALGAGRGRIVRQLLTESTLLSVVGGMLGIALAWIVKDTIVAFSPPNVARFKEVTIDGNVLAFSLGLSFITGLIFGLWPTLKLSRMDLREALQSGGRRASDGPAGRRLRQSLVTIEVALTVVLLISGCLLIKSLSRLQNVSLGYQPSGLLLSYLNLSANYDSDAKINGFYDELLTRVRALPGVEDVALNTSPPLNNGWQSGFDVIGRDPYPPGTGPSAEISVISSSYFHTMNIPIVRGRPFGPEDTPNGQMGMIIDEAFAKMIWPGENALGKQIRIFAKPSVTVVGIVPTVKLDGYGNEPKLIQVYFPQSQIAADATGLIVRTAGDPTVLTQPIRRAVFEIDPTQPVYAVSTLEHDLYDSISSPRLMAYLSTVFSVLALLLASIGLYGVVSYGISQQIREIGIRVALGARTGDVLRKVIGQGMTSAVTGVVIGVIAAFAATRLISGLLFGVSSTDAVSFIGIPVLLVVVAFLACYIPARKAAKVDPMIALRCD